MSVYSGSVASVMSDDEQHFQREDEENAVGDEEDDGEGPLDDVGDEYNDGNEYDDTRDRNEDGMSYLDHQVNDAIQKRRDEKERARAAGDLAFVDNVDEKLGDDFEDTPWVPPTIELVSELEYIRIYD